MNSVTETFEVRVVPTHREPVADGGWKTVSDPAEVHRFQVSVDLERLARKLGPKAFSSQGKQSVEAGGCVVVRHIGPARHMSGTHAMMPTP